MEFKKVGLQTASFKIRLKEVNSCIDLGKNTMYSTDTL